MSIKVKTTDIDTEKVSEDLHIELPASRYAKNKKPQYVYPYRLTDNNDLYLPFGYAMKLLKKDCRPSREFFPQSTFKFNATLRENQEEVKKEALHFLNTHGVVMISAYPGFGKCLKLNTPVIMYDGSIKMVQDIKIGDKLMGDDSTARNVLNTCTGQEQMYDIVPDKGEPFGCNESHILSLKFSGHKTIIWDIKQTSYFVRWFDKINMKCRCKYYNNYKDAEKFCDSIKDNEIIDISVKDYLKLAVCIKTKLKLYHVPLEFNEIDIIIDPYLLGLWLGNGTSSQFSITTTDEPIVDYIYNYAKEISMIVSVSDDGIRTPTYCFVTPSKKCNHIILDMMKQYNLRGNKHIPDVFKYNSRKNRLRLLAGLIDTNGYCIKNCYEITQKNKRLAHDIAYLTRSLGFMTTVKEVQKSCVYKGIKKKQTYYMVRFYGDNSIDIPILLERKRLTIRYQNKDPLMSRFKIIPIKDRDYYGFTIDGNHRFLLGDCTVTHNTISAIKLASMIKLPTLIITKGTAIIDQWKESVERFSPDATCQIIKPKTKLRADQNFYVINAENTVKIDPRLMMRIGLLIVDEAHQIMTETLSKSLTCVTPRYVIGLTATPYRYDGYDMLFGLYFGISNDRLLSTDNENDSKKNPLIYRKLWVSHTVYRINTGFKPPIELNAQGKPDWGKILDAQACDTNRNESIIKLIKKFDKRVFLILTKRVAQAEYLLLRLKEEGEDVTSLFGTQKTYRGEARILIGTTQKVGTGFDHPRLDTMLLATDTLNYFIQNLGRVCRSPDVRPIFFDLVDDYVILKKHFNERKDVYLEHGGKFRDFESDYPDFVF